MSLKSIYLVLILLFSCETVEVALSEIILSDPLVQELPQSFIRTNDYEQTFDFNNIYPFDGGYRIGLFNEDSSKAHIESLLVYTSLIQGGEFNLDASIDARMIKGIMRVPIDTITGTSFSFLNSPNSQGRIEIDSISSTLFFANILYTVYHPLKEGVYYEIEGRIEGAPR